MCLYVTATQLITAHHAEGQETVEQRMLEIQVRINNGCVDTVNLHRPFASFPCACLS